jgi:hypothetical protein
MFGLPPAAGKPLLPNLRRYSSLVETIVPSGLVLKQGGAVYLII